MNIYNFNDENFKNTQTYQNFIKANPGIGYLKIRASAASQAIPISGLRIVVSKTIGTDKIVFFEGETNSSGVIERIDLPAPKQNTDDLTTPNNIVYDINATYKPDNLNDVYKVNIYENIYVVQRINVVPTINVAAGDRLWL